MFEKERAGFMTGTLFCYECQMSDAKCWTFYSFYSLIGAHTIVKVGAPVKSILLLMLPQRMTKFILSDTP